MSALHKKRHGFSLIELLVVIAIIGVLMAIGGGAYFRIRAANMRKNNDATLSKINTLLDSRWHIIRESATDDIKKQTTLGKAALASAGNDADAAKTLLFYAKLKNEFPMTYAEAKSTVVVGSIILQPRPVFLSLPASAATTEEESAVCLYIALTTSGSGGTSTDTEGLQGQVISTTSGQKVFADAWGQPIAFARQVYHTELNASPYIRTGGGTNLDPLNPSGKATTYLTTYWTQLRSNTPAWANVPAAYSATVNHVPSAISSGPDRQWGTDHFAGDNQVSFRLRREGNRGD